MGYFKETFLGISWIGSFKLFSRLLSILRTVIIARILSPSQVGIFGIAALALSLIETLTETGINVVLIQRKEKVDEYIDTAWIISIGRGITIFLLIFLSAGFVANFFKAPQVYPLLILISFVPLLRGFINPSVVGFQKELRFHKEFYYRLSILLTETTISLVLVLMTREPIAMIWGLVGGAVFEVIISFIVVKPLPKIAFNKIIFKDVLHNGKWITSSGIFSYLFSNADNVVVGKVLGTHSLGIYDMAYTIALMPTTEISEVVARVTFPVYSKFSEDKERLKKAFIKTTAVITLLIAPIVMIFLFFPTEIIKIFLGEKWLGATQILQALSIFAATVAIFSPAGALFYSVKKQNYNLIISLVSFIVMILLIYPMIINFGLLGAVIAATIGAISPIPLLIYFLHKIF